ncbi:glutaredoxin [Chloropicon primus]|uniref:Glutaredoxin n=1 Tax=Chloropicon primus TaxID=1764295 RepID=A0A5B8MV94_9CHLO|nr:glutaredoxin [Chloropicon primus]UPR03448.1 glutaredoxin [Chloropicon primus]|eukprot:QDZ24241.1 glutaredoxin [Chloropicon primus]
MTKAGGSGSEDGGGLVEKIASLNAENGVVIYSKSWCPFCSQAKAIFDGLDTQYFALELDEIEEGPDVQEALQELTGVRTVPQVFVKGEFIGGCDDTKEALARGDLQKLVAKL